jgi:hypothetical protein
MRRRELISPIGGTSAVSFAAPAQQPAVPGLAFLVCRVALLPMAWTKSLLLRLYWPAGGQLISIKGGDRRLD